MSIFYTGKGDSGKSLLWNNIKIEKSSHEIDLLGNLDELNSLLGVIRSQSPKNLKKVILDVQQNLFLIQANVFFLIIGEKKKAPPFTEQKTTDLENQISKIEKVVSPKRKFIISGETKTSAWLDFARSNVRRMERSAYVFNKKKRVPKEILTYLNRLSSLFFALARREADAEGVKEQNPKY